MNLVKVLSKTSAAGYVRQSQKLVNSAKGDQGEPQRGGCASTHVPLLESQTLGSDAVARLRNIMAREGIDETTLIQRNIQAPIRWFREVYPARCRPGNYARIRVRRAGSVDVLWPVGLSSGQCGFGSRDRQAAHPSAFTISTASAHSFIQETRGSPSGSGDITQGDPALNCLVVTYAVMFLRLLDMLRRRAVPTVTTPSELGWSAPLPLANREDALTRWAPVLRRSDVLPPCSRGYPQRGYAGSPIPSHIDSPSSICSRTSTSGAETTSFSEKVRRLLEKDRQTK